MTNTQINAPLDSTVKPVDNGKTYINHKNNIHEYNGSVKDLLIEISAFYKENFKAFQGRNIITHVSLESYTLLKNLNVNINKDSGLFTGLIEKEKNFGNYKILSKLVGKDGKPEDIFRMILNKLGNKNAVYDSYPILNILFKEKTNEIANAIISELIENGCATEAQHKGIKDSIIEVITNSKEVITDKISNKLVETKLIKEEKMQQTYEVLDLFVKTLMEEITDLVKSIKQAKVFLNKIAANAISIDHGPNLDKLFENLIGKKDTKFTLDAKKNAKQITLGDSNLDCFKYFYLEEILESFDDFIYKDIKDSVFSKIEKNTALIDIKNYRKECESDKKILQERIAEADKRSDNEEKTSIKVSA